MTFSNPIVGGVTLIRPAIQSPDYISGSSGWSINKDGSAEFNDITIRGSGTEDAVVVGDPNGLQVVIGSTADDGQIRFPTHAASENDIATIQTGVLNDGLPNEAITFQILGPTTDGASDRARIFVNSQNNDGSSQASVQQTAGTATASLTEDTYFIQGPRLNVAPSDSALSALFATVSGTYTGNLIRVTKGGTDYFRVDSSGNLILLNDLSAVDATLSGNITAQAATFNGNLTANNIQKGLAAITTVAGAWAEVAVTFPHAFDTTPVVLVTGNNNAPAVGGTTQLYSTATTVTTTGFVLRVYRQTAIAMNFGWLAIA